MRLSFSNKGMSSLQTGIVIFLAVLSNKVIEPK